MMQQGSTAVALASLSALLIQESLKAFLVNPEEQRNELEADQIGLFILADADYNPERAVAFWERVKDDPDFAGSPLPIFSSHPPSAERVAHLRELLPLALERYRRKSGQAPPSAAALSDSTALPEPAELAPHEEIWIVMEPEVTVFATLHAERPVGRLTHGSRVVVEALVGRWLRIRTPVPGYLRSHDLAPAAGR